MRRKFLPAILIMALLPKPALANEKDWGTISDVGATALITFSIALPIIKKDKNGAFQAAGSLAASSLITEGLKQAFPKTRPDGSDRKSFPSGHTSRSFSAAATIFNRYGAAYGIPAFAVASLVGVARVKAKKHFWSDVLVGAAIGTGSGFLLTHKQAQSDRAASIVPWGDTKSGGFTFAMRF
jgi:membrane-associated phospholipid phosphatase